jgi:hypothetical protein
MTEDQNRAMSPVFDNVWWIIRFAFFTLSPGRLKNYYLFHNAKRQWTFFKCQLFISQHISLYNLYIYYFTSGTGIFWKIGCKVYSTYIKKDFLEYDLPFQVCDLHPISSKISHNYFYLCKYLQWVENVIIKMYYLTKSCLSFVPRKLLFWLHSRE